MSIDQLVVSTRRSPARAAIVIGLAVALIASLATIFAGQTHAEHGGLIHGPVQARAPFTDPTAVQLRGMVGGKLMVSNANNLEDMVIQRIQVEPGGFTGWHTHHGPVVVLVQSGEFSVYQANDPNCTAYRYGPNESFVDPGQGNVHGARNEGAVPMVAWAVYFDVPAGNQTLLIPVTTPGDSCADF